MCKSYYFKQLLVYLSKSLLHRLHVNEHDSMPKRYTKSHVYSRHLFENNLVLFQFICHKSEEIQTKALTVIYDIPYRATEADFC